MTRSLLKFFASLCLTMTLTASSLAIANEPVRYTITLVGNVAGEQTVTQRADGSLVIDHAYNDRGRGPQTRTTYQLGRDGLPTAVAIEGVDYMKAPVDESFERSGGTARWTSGADRGSTQAEGFYVALDGPPESTAVLARALLAADDNGLPLLPAGEARLEEVESITLEAGRTVRHVEIHGLDFEPVPLWLNADGTLFASVDGWISVFERAAEPHLERLRERQEARRSARFAQMAEQARHVPTALVLIENARILDVRTGQVRPENAVLVHGDHIAALLLPDAERPATPEVVDADGRTLMPGLWDMHAHLDLIDGPLNIAAG
ncbi:MAG TPA: hypothetical protein VLT59_08405, partial [Steroidobacteraceae bacterium]|nr:hypothetical protein [Steroidobacteraceae bacterium]